jgi:hypothetical protein
MSRDRELALKVPILRTEWIIIIDGVVFLTKHLWKKHSGGPFCGNLDAKAGHEKKLVSHFWVLHASSYIFDLKKYSFLNLTSNF